MNKEKIKNLALQILAGLNTQEVESITITDDVYADGTPYTTISIDYHEGGENNA